MSDWAEGQPEKCYQKRSAMALDQAGRYYIRHASAMTAEGLHDKSDIASTPLT